MYAELHSTYRFVYRKGLRIRLSTLIPVIWAGLYKSVARYLLCKYLPATLSANDGRIMNTVMASSFAINVCSPVPGPTLGDVRISSMPSTPKVNDE